MIKLTALSTLICFLVGQTSTSIGLPGVGVIANWSAVTLIGVLLYTLIVYQQPKERKERNEHTEKIINRICAEFRSVQDQQHLDNQAFNKNLNSMTKQCEKTRGTMVGLVRGSACEETDG